MALTPIAGVTRLRALQFGIETTFKTQVAATRRMPWAVGDGSPVNPGWTDPSADTGTLDQAIAPYKTALDVTLPVSGQLFSNDAPTILSGGVMGGLSFTTSSTSKTLTAAPASLTQDVIDSYTIEWFDDASADAFAATGCVLNDFALEYPQDQGPINFSGNWLGSKVVYPATPTGSLSVDTNPVPLFCADTQFYVNSTAGAIGTTQLVDQVYGASFAVNNNIDRKHFANGSNTRFETQSLSRGNRVIDWSLTLAKATAAIAEAVLWLAASPTERFAEFRTTSVVAAAAGIPHSLSIRIPGFWFTRANTTVNTNTGFTMAGRNVYDATLTYPYRMVSVSTRSAL